MVRASCWNHLNTIWMDVATQDDQRGTGNRCARPSQFMNSFGDNVLIFKTITPMRHDMTTYVGFRYVCKHNVSTVRHCTTPCNSKFVQRPLDKFAICCRFVGARGFQQTRMPFHHWVRRLHENNPHTLISTLSSNPVTLGDLLENTISHFSTPSHS